MVGRRQPDNKKQTPDKCRFGNSGRGRQGAEAGQELKEGEGKVGKTYNRVFCPSSSLSQPRQQHVRPGRNPFIIQTLFCLCSTSIIA